MILDCQEVRDQLHDKFAVPLGISRDWHCIWAQIQGDVIDMEFGHALSLSKLKLTLMGPFEDPAE